MPLAKRSAREYSRHFRDEPSGRPPYRCRSIAFAHAGAGRSQQAAPDRCLRIFRYTLDVFANRGVYMNHTPTRARMPSPSSQASDPPDGCSSPPSPRSTTNRGLAGLARHGCRRGPHLLPPKALVRRARTTPSDSARSASGRGGAAAHRVRTSGRPRAPAPRIDCPRSRRWWRCARR